MEGPGLRASRVRRGHAVTILAAMFVVTACVGTGEVATATPTVTPASVATAAPATPVPSDAVDPSPDESLDPEATPSEDPFASPDTAAACTGTDANREFFTTVAEKVTWDVYCAVLPRGWSVEAGSYRTSSGGWLKITYKASGDRRFELREGAFCTDPATCVPTGVEIAPGPFGDREAEVVQVEDGGFAMVVDRGQRVMWAAIGKGMDETTFRMHAEALLLVSY